MDSDEETPIYILSLEITLFIIISGTSIYNTQGDRITNVNAVNHILVHVLKKNLLPQIVLMHLVIK